MEVRRLGAYGAIAVGYLQTGRRHDLEPDPPAVAASAVRDHLHCRPTVTTPRSAISNHRARLITPNPWHYSAASILNEFNTVLHFPGILHVISRLPHFPSPRLLIAYTTSIASPTKASGEGSGSYSNSPLQPAARRNPAGVGFAASSVFMICAIRRRCGEAASIEEMIMVRSRKRAAARRTGRPASSSTNSWRMAPVMTPNL